MKVRVFSEEEFESFCALESLSGVESITLAADVTQWNIVLEYRLLFWAARMKPHEFILDSITLMNSNGVMVPFVPRFIEAIGKLRCRLNLFLNVYSLGFCHEGINWGNIAGLYAPIPAYYHQVFENCCTTRLVRGGIRPTQEFVDDFALATRILAGQTDGLYSNHPIFASALRWNRLRVQMYERVRICMALVCKEIQIPRHVMQIIVSNLCPDDWSEMNFMPLDPKWVEPVVRLGCFEIPKIRHKIQGYSEALLNTGDIKYENLLELQKNQLEYCQQELQTYKDRFRTNKFGLPCLGPKKRRKIAI